jgi:hypothetical protein
MGDKELYVGRQTDEVQKWINKQTKLKIKTTYNKKIKETGLLKY